jgi:hypothetical protein
LFSVISLLYVFVSQSTNGHTVIFLVHVIVSIQSDFFTVIVVVIAFAIAVHNVPFSTFAIFAHSHAFITVAFMNVHHTFAHHIFVVATLSHVNVLKSIFILACIALFVATSSFVMKFVPSYIINGFGNIGVLPL